MASPQRLVLFVEGDGDREAVPILVKRLLTEMNAWSDVFLDVQPFVVGNVAKLTAQGGKGWVGRHIEAGYKPTRDQRLVTELMVDHLDAVRARGMRSFQRLEKALSELVHAVRTGTPIVTPEASSAATE